MIVLDKQTIPFLVAGRIVETKPKGPTQHRKGRVYRVSVWTWAEDKNGKPVKKPRMTEHRARVIAVDGDQIAIVLATDAKPRFLAASFGRGDYVSDPLRAAKGEPEALSVEDQEKMSKPLRDRDDSVRRERAAQDRIVRKRAA